MFFLYYVQEKKFNRLKMSSEKTRLKRSLFSAKREPDVLVPLQTLPPELQTKIISYYKQTYFKTVKQLLHSYDVTIDFHRNVNYYLYYKRLKLFLKEHNKENLSKTIKKRTPQFIKLLEDYGVNRNFRPYSGQNFRLSKILQLLVTDDIFVLESTDIWKILNGLKLKNFMLRFDGKLINFYIEKDGIVWKKSGADIFDDEERALVTLFFQYLIDLPFDDDKITIIPKVRFPFVHVEGVEEEEDFDFELDESDHLFLNPYNNVTPTIASLMKIDKRIRNDGLSIVKQHFDVNENDYLSFVEGETIIEKMDNHTYAFYSEFV